MAGAQNLYSESTRPKRDGGVRIIESPQPVLREVQRDILRTLQKVQISPAAHGGVKGRSIVTNAMVHREARSLYSVDIQDAFGHAFFPLERGEIGIGRISDYTLFLDLVERRVSRPDTSIWRLPHLRRYLPQGAPTSSYVFDLFLDRLGIDRDLLALAERSGCRYSRYVDNIFFSSQEPRIDHSLRQAVNRILREKRWIIMRFPMKSTSVRLELNPEKTYYVANGNRPGVPLRLTGLNIIDGELRLRPEMIDRYRIALFCALRSGNHDEANGIIGYCRQVYGVLPHRLQAVVDRYNLDST